MGGELGFVQERASLEDAGQREGLVREPTWNLPVSQDPGCPSPLTPQCWDPAEGSPEVKKPVSLSV